MFKSARNVGLAFVSITLCIWLSGCLPRSGAAKDEISGTIAVHGYSVVPSDILVRARPLDGASADDMKARTVVTSAIRALGGSIQFRLTGLSEDVPYRIGIKVDNQDTKQYPRLVWKSNHDPLALAGDSSLRFDAYAVRSEIEVMGSALGRGREAWVAADALDFTNPDQETRTFRWRTTLADVTGGELQISIVPFPRVAQSDYDPCADGNEGVIYTEDFDMDVEVGEWVTLPSVDFSTLLLAGHDDDPTWETQVVPKLEAGLPLYVRVIPKIAGMVVCDPDDAGVPPEVLLAFIALGVLDSPPVVEPEVAIGMAWYNTPVYGPRPYPGEACYRITKNHQVKPFFAGGSVWDAVVNAHLSGVSYYDTANRGMTFCVPPSNDDEGWVESFVDSFGAVLTGIVDAVGDIVNYASKLWEEIQDTVVDVVADAITEVGIVNCGPKCRSALETGLEIGLATMGVPPSLPNFDELVDQGFDYLAAEVASQAGVPDVLADYASQEAQDFVKKVAKDLKTTYHTPGLPDWLAADIGFKPAYVLMELYGPGTSHPFVSQPRLIRNNTLIYAGAMVQLPIQLPELGVEAPILYPMVLQPQTKGLPELPPTIITFFGKPIIIPPTEYEKSVWNKNQWIANRYENPASCYWLYLTALSNPGGVYNVLSAKFRPTDASIPCEP